MRYLSVCSGIEAASVAWHPLGWEPAAFSEIEAFPRAVLAHHYPTVPLHGDFTTIQGTEYGPIDLLVGGTPCQSFSVAGLRGGLADDRGNLALEFLRLAQRTRARWVVWENVPGVLSSNGGRDFGSILGGLAELGYGWAYRIVDAQYVRVDGYARAVPQRRRRVFVVGHLGDWRRAAAVLFEREGLQGNLAPRREAGQGTADGVAKSLRGRSNDSHRNDSSTYVPLEVASTLDAHYGDKQGLDNQHINAGGGCSCTAKTLTGKMQRNDSETETLLPMRGGSFDVAHSLKADGFDASEDGDGTGRGTPIIAIQDEATRGNPQSGPGGKGWRDDGASFTHQADHVQAVLAVDLQQVTSKANRSRPTSEAPPLTTGGSVVAFQDVYQQDQFVPPDAVVPTLAHSNNHHAGHHQPKLWQGMAVRRLTPRECERLQGFPDAIDP